MAYLDLMDKVSKGDHAQRDKRSVGEVPDVADRKFVRAIVQAFGLALILLLGVGISFFTTHARQISLGAQTLAEYDYVLTLSRIQQNIIEEQSAQRGYILTGNTLYLSEYDASRAALPGQLDHLAKILPSQNRYLFDQLSHEIYSTQANLDDLNGIIHLSGLKTTEELAVMNKGEASIGPVMELIGNITRQHKLDIELLAREREELFDRLLELGVTAIVFAFLLCGGAAILFARRRLSKLEIERSTALQNARLVAQRNEFSLANDSLELASKRFEMLFQSIPVVCVYTDTHGGILEWNEAAEKMFGWTRDEALRLTVFQTIVPPSQIAEAKRCVAAAVSGRSLSEMQWLCLTKEGHQIDVMAYVIPMLGDDGEPIGTLASMVDITQRKAIERLKSEFVSTVSHELRSPLTSISGALGLVCSGASGTLSDEASRLCQIANKNTDRLVRLINDILDIERIDSGHFSFNFVECLMTDLVRSTVEKERAAATASSVSICLTSGPADLRILADPDRIMQVVHNLISNAVKFSPQGCEVTVKVQQIDSSVVVSIEDCGPGIPTKFRSRLFDRFAQADGGDTRQKGGSGLGLSISKSIIELHNGKIWFDPCMVGTRFSFQLPLIEDSEAGNHPGESL